MSETNHVPGQQKVKYLKEFKLWQWAKHPWASPIQKARLNLFAGIRFSHESFIDCQNILEKHMRIHALRMFWQDGLSQQKRAVPWICSAQVVARLRQVLTSTKGRHNNMPLEARTCLGSAQEISCEQWPCEVNEKHVARSVGGTVGKLHAYIYIDGTYWITSNTFQLCYSL